MTLALLSLTGCAAFTPSIKEHVSIRYHFPEGALGGKLAQITNERIEAQTARGAEIIGELTRTETTIECLGEQSCDLKTEVDCAKYTGKPWPEEELIRSATAINAEWVTITQDRHTELTSGWRNGKCTHTSPGRVWYDNTCNASGQCWTIQRNEWICDVYEQMHITACVETSRATLLVSSPAMLASIRSQREEQRAEQERQRLRDEAEKQIAQVAERAERRFSGFNFKDGPHKSGYIGHNGKFIIPAIYDVAFDFSQGRAVIADKTGTEWHQKLINVAGKIIPTDAEPTFGAQFSDGLIPAGFDFKQPRILYLDLQGKTALKLDLAASGGNFSEGLAAVFTDKGKRCGYINTSGTIIVPIDTYNSCGAFHEGLAKVSQGDKQGFIDKKGNVRIAFDSYTDVGSFSKGLAYIAKGKLGGYIKPSGELAFSLNSIYFARVLVPSFGEGGLAPGFFRGDRVGYIDTKGIVKISADYANAKPFSEGLAPAAVQLRNGYYVWGFIRTDGKWAIEPQFLSADGFIDGKARVSVPIR